MKCKSQSFKEGIWDADGETFECSSFGLDHDDTLVDLEAISDEERVQVLEDGVAAARLLALRLLSRSDESHQLGVH